MKKGISILLLLALCLGLAACGGDKQEQNSALEPKAVEALAGQTLAGGTTLEVKDCAAMVCYQVEGDQASVEDDLKAAGYVPMAEQGEGKNVYFITSGEDGNLTVMTLGESDTLHPSVQSEGKRRFAGKNPILKLADVTEWQVLSVEEQDYYEDGGKQYPCYFIVLGKA